MIPTLKNKATLSILARMRQAGAPSVMKKGVTEIGYEPDQEDDNQDEQQLDNIANPTEGLMDSDPNDILRKQAMLMAKKKKQLV